MTKQLRKIGTFFKEATEFAGVRTRQIIFEYDFVYGEVLCASLDLWYWFVLTVSPNYLSSSVRLATLLKWAPAWQWQMMFAMLSFYKLMMVLFASWSHLDAGVKVVANPMMRTDRQTQQMYGARWLGLLCSVFFYVMLGALLSIDSVSWGTGTFGLLFVLCFVSLVKVGSMLANSMQVALERRKQRKEVAPQCG